jgi:uracil-DNA glycosylase family 4
VAPGRDCPDCPRLADWRQSLRAEYPTWFNAPVPSFGPATARLLIVGLAPGLRGANRTGRPFTGDYAGDLLFATLARFGFSRGTYAARPDDGLCLDRVRIANAVRCVPPENRPMPSEIAACRRFLVDEIAQLPELRVILALGQIAHHQVVRTLGLKPRDLPFRHGGLDPVAVAAGAGPVMLAGSYHCSRYNTNTGRLTAAMFEAVFAAIVPHLG